MNPSPQRQRPRLGVWLYPDAPARRLVDAVVTAEVLGLDEVWIADEGVAREPVPLLAAAATRTESIRLAAGITTPLLRHPGALASSFATLDELSEGRAVLGLGLGGHESLGPFGISPDRPVAVLGDAIRTARAVLGRRPDDGYEPPPHAAPARDVPLWVGARGPQLTRLAARVADGLFLSGCSPEELGRIVPDVRSVRPDLELALYHSASEETDGRPSVSSWEAVAEHLGALVERWAPAAVGINLVDLARPSADPVALVERAAATLAVVAG
jgi:5,10-methylenetetrahydromethanopterin reductase